VVLEHCDDVNLRLQVESATHPIEPHCGALALLLLLAGMSPQRRRA
jgi:hypothetical protein